MSPGPLPTQDSGAQLRRVHLRPDLGAAAHVLQARSLRIVRVAIEAPALIIVTHGCKTVQVAGGTTVRAAPGQAVALAGGQIVDFANEAPPGARYEARWLVFGHAVCNSFAARQALQAAPNAHPHPARLLSELPQGLHEAFARACQALAPGSERPDAVVAHHLHEVMLWLALQGVAFSAHRAPPSLSERVRALLAGRLGHDWQAGQVAGELAMSEPTLRRRLAGEGHRFGDLLVDARMSFALTQLQASDQSIAAIAQNVGYASASRFAARFRHRFGFAPSAVRVNGREG
ncbi:helix-turn-helix transcriptional regulator [Rubrivivax gelatinosus]|uniref:HTH araC/xylS-type domain-containing protein n=1 Tax=Rubrivivax gelatinosus TaxID=28068 RepID=A0ABS1DS85_RUBGE|nr:hypothetical protein [Rubrivivax gelatinosus]